MVTELSRERNFSFLTVLVKVSFVFSQFRQPRLIIITPCISEKTLAYNKFLNNTELTSEHQRLYSPGSDICNSPLSNASHFLKHL